MKVIVLGVNVRTDNSKVISALEAEIVALKQEINEYHKALFNLYMSHGEPLDPIFKESWTKTMDKAKAKLKI